MAFVVKQVVVACLDYKDCNDNKATGKIEFNFADSEIKFLLDDDYEDGKATIKIEDLRELIRVYDEQNALNPGKAEA